MDTGRLLAQGVGGWLLYEFCANRSRLFNERYLAMPIAQVLHAQYGYPVRSEFVHPVLAPTKVGPGRRPEIDFAVVDDTSAIRCVVESKWCGVRGLATEDIIWDVLRLELVATSAGADAFFLLAGRRRHLEKFFESVAFKGTERSGQSRGRGWPTHRGSGCSPTGDSRWPSARPARQSPEKSSVDPVVDGRCRRTSAR